MEETTKLAKGKAYLFPIIIMIEVGRHHLSAGWFFKKV